MARLSQCSFLTVRDGRGGIILMDKDGNTGISFNTLVMATDIRQAYLS